MWIVTYTQRWFAYVGLSRTPTYEGYRIREFAKTQNLFTDYMLASPTIADDENQNKLG